ncbi:MAG: hypothetical protein HZA24_00510 [Nitrospirae bacterium]|nr:hypothetical protein [Nitrospirota bacterium]
MVDRDAFEAAVAFVLRLEGGYSDSPIDPGGETKFGISKRQYPHLDIRALTEDEARGIYRRDYWLPYYCDRIEYAPLRAHYFSTVVNIGPGDAGRYLQRAVNATGGCLTVDGIVGPVTRDAVNTTAEPGLLLNAFLAQVVEHHIARGYDGLLKGLVRRAVAFPKELVGA